MTVDPIPLPLDPTLEALIEFTACVGGALEDLCSYGFIHGESYVPFAPDPEDDCDEDETMCSQAWVRVSSIAPSAGPEGWGGDCASLLTFELEVGVIRCIEIPDGGEAPSAADLLIAAGQAMTDMNAIHCAAINCDAWGDIRAGSWAPMGPQGGQYGGTWTFTVSL